MNPWLIFWAPQLHFPFGGSVAQRIEPNTNWFFDSIESTAGDPTIERKAFAVASYGRQLGLLIELLVDVSASAKPSTKKGQQALVRLQAIQAEIEKLKEKDSAAITAEIEALVLRLKERHKGDYPRLRKQLERALAAEAAEATSGP